MWWLKAVLCHPAKLAKDYCRELFGSWLPVFRLRMPALDLKCITKLKAMQQRATAAFEGCLSHVDQKWKSSDFWNLPCSIAGQWGHLSVNSSAFFSIHMMSNGQSGFCVSKAKKICSWLVTAFVPDSRHRTLPAQWYLCHKHVALCSQYPHCLPYPPHPSCPGDVIWRCVKVSDTDLQQSEKISAQLGIWNLLLYWLWSPACSLKCKLQGRAEVKKTVSAQNLSEGRILMQRCKA